MIAWGLSDAVKRLVGHRTILTASRARAAFAAPGSTRALPLRCRAAHRTRARFRPMRVTIPRAEPAWGRLFFTRAQGGLRPPSLGTRSTGPAGPRPARSCELRPGHPRTHADPNPPALGECQPGACALARCFAPVSSRIGSAGTCSQIAMIMLPRRPGGRGGAYFGIEIVLRTRLHTHAVRILLRRGSDRFGLRFIPRGAWRPPRGAPRPGNRRNDEPTSAIRAKPFPACGVH